MHILQSKHTKLNPVEVKKLLDKYGISLSQLPMIKAEDPALEGKFIKGDVAKIERKDRENSINYYRVVV